MWGGLLVGDGGWTLLKMKKMLHVKEYVSKRLTELHELCSGFQVLQRNLKFTTEQHSQEHLKYFHNKQPPKKKVVRLKYVCMGIDKDTYDHTNT